MGMLICLSTIRWCRTNINVVLSKKQFLSLQSCFAAVIMEAFSGSEQWRTQEFCLGGGSTNSVEDRGQREQGSGGGSPLVRGSGGSCNFVQEISFHIVKFS